MPSRSTRTAPSPTRRLLLDAALDLFAARGIDAVSLAQITQAAGLRNTGAIHHHFGSREELLAALVDEHRQRLDQRREALLDEVETAGGDPVAPLVRALVLPMVELLDDPSGRRFLSIQAQRVLRPRPAPATPRPVVRRLLRLEGRPRGRAPVAGFLADLAELTAVTALAQRARLEEADGRDAGLGRDEFTHQLLDAITRIVAVRAEEAPS